MAVCHGSGNLGEAFGDGCCWVGGAVCPLRWKISGGRIFDHTGTDLGTVDAVVRSHVGNNPQRRQRVLDQLQGVTFVCTAAVDVIVADPSLLNDRPAFDAAWNNHAGYLAQVRPGWAALEQTNGWAPGSYQCSTWTGAAGPECCFAEDPASNTTKLAALSVSAVTIRSARAG